MSALQSGQAQPGSAFDHAAAYNGAPPLRTGTLGKLHPYQSRVTNRFWQSPPCGFLSTRKSRARQRALIRAMTKVWSQVAVTSFHTGTEEKPMRLTKRYQGTVRGFHCIGSKVSRMNQKTPRDGVWLRIKRKPGAYRVGRRGWRARCCGQGLHASLTPALAYFEYGWCASKVNDGISEKYLTMVDVRHVGDARNDKFAGKERRIVARITFAKAEELSERACDLSMKPGATQSHKQHFNRLVRAEFKRILANA